MFNAFITRLLAPLLCVASVSSLALADAFNWSNPAGGAWGVAGNWSPAGGPPIVGDTATFTINVTYSVQTPQGSRADAVTASAGNVTLHSNSTTIRGQLDINSGAADLTVNNTAHLTIGSPSRRLEVNVGDTIEIAGNGQFTIASGSEVITSVMRVGRGSGFFASASITGPGSSLSVKHATTPMSIGGDGGTGQVFIDDQAIASFEHTEFRNGTIFLNTDGALTVESLTIGSPFALPTLDSALLRVTGGAEVTQAAGTMEVARGGRIEVDAMGIVTADVLMVGNEGTTILRNDGIINADSLQVSDAASIEMDGGTFTVQTTTSLASSGTMSLRSGTFTSNGALSLLDAASIVVDGGTVDSNVETALFDGAKVFVRSGKFETELLRVNDATSRFTLEGGELETGGISLVGGQFDWRSGTVTLTDGTFAVPRAVPFGGTLNTARDGAVTINGPFFQSANSTINAQGNTTLGSTTAVNGFASQGTLAVNNRTVTLRDANDAVFDSAALVTLGTGSNQGTLVAANGITVDFGANITGFGTVNTPNNATQPLINNGHIAGNSAAQRITLTGYVKGVGTLNNVLITGTDAPGFSPATVYRGSVDYNGTLEIEVGGTTPGSFDRIIHSGVATLGGTLDVSLLDGFTPTAGDAFQILTAAGGVSGAFATELLPALGGGLFLDVLYSANAVSLSVAGVAGDYNRNGTVDAADYVLWRKTLGQMGVGLTADGNDNGSIDASDYDVWRANFGRTAGAASGSSVGAAAPEPMSCVLLLTAALAAICCRRAAIY